MSTHDTDIRVRVVRCDCGSDTYRRTVTLTGTRVWECWNCRKVTHRRRPVFRKRVTR